MRLLLAAATSPGWRVRCLGVMLLAVCAHAAAANDLSLRLRLAWGANAEARYRGTIGLSQGTLAELEPLGIEADEPGSMWLDGEAGQSNALMLGGRTLRALDGADVLINAPRDAELRIDLTITTPAPRGGKPSEAVRVTTTVPVSELVANPKTIPLGDTKGRLSISRSPGDRLRVAFDRPNLIFAPKEAFTLRVSPHELGLPLNTPVEVRGQVIAVHQGAGAGKDRLWSGQYEESASGADDEKTNPYKTLDVRLPDVEGVYEIALTAIDARLSERLKLKRAVAERKVQVVVVDRERSPYVGKQASGWTKVREIDPLNPGWMDSVAQMPWWPGGKRGSLGNVPPGRYEHPSLGPMVQLAASINGTPSKLGAGDVAWEAYPMPVADVGLPHILEVEYPSDVPQSLGISIVEPNAAGAVIPHNVDSGVYVTSIPGQPAAVMHVHRVLFWPRTNAPIVLLSQRGTQPSVYRKLRLLAPPRGQLASIPLAGRALSKTPPHVALPPAAIVAQLNERAAKRDKSKTSLAPFAASERLLAAYFDRPLANEAFSAPESLDAASGRSLDDWTTFYLGTERMAEYLQHVGYNAAVMNVAADGSAIYPSDKLAPTPKYDTGTLFGTGQDALRKDALELAFSVFDRERLLLVPGMQFASPLVELEALLRTDAEAAEGLELVGADGRAWLHRFAPKQGLAPYYNPLDPRVQQAMLGAVDELIERYGDHPSFGGVSIAMSADGYTQLPSGDWGFDDRTVERFTRAVRPDLRDCDALLRSGEERFRQRTTLLGGKLSKQWLAWRADELEKLYRTMAEHVRTKHPGAKLYLATGNLFDGPASQRLLRPTLPRRANIEDALLGMGLRSDGPRGGANANDNLVWMRPERTVSPEAAMRQATASELPRANGFDERFNATAASFFHHEPDRLRLASFEEQSPFGKAKTYLQMTSQLSPSAEENRRRFVHALAGSDCRAMIDGGWLLPLGQEDALADFVTVYRQLPLAAFERLEAMGKDNTQVENGADPVVFRVHRDAANTWFYAANDSPFAARARLKIVMPKGCGVERLGLNRQLPASEAVDGGMAWNIDLAAYEVLAVRFASPAVKLADPASSIDDAAKAGLELAIHDLGERVRTLAQPQPFAAPANASFEEVEAGDVPKAWYATLVPQTAMKIDATQAHVTEETNGTHGLHLTSEGPRLVVRSDMFAAPATGRLAVAVWMKVANPAIQPAVRMCVEATSETGDYVRYATVGGRATNATALTTEWSQYEFQVDDLPPAALGSGRTVNLRFDLMDAGEVWIDDVKTFSLAFSETERVELTKLVSLADYKRQSGQAADCWRLLESHWPRYLFTHVPKPDAAKLARRTASNPKVRVKPVDEPKKGVLDKVRDWVPRF